MAVELCDLYKEIYYDYEVNLLTTSCFNKKISWMHVMEKSDFTYLLHGGELIFNSELNWAAEESRKEFIDHLIAAGAGGLIAALQENHMFSQELVSYCSEKKFPLFRAGWETSYLEIMHRFSEILLSHERNETNLIAAFKNAVYYPNDDKLYRNHFERNGFYQDIPYTVVVLGSGDSDSRSEAGQMAQIEKSFRHIINKSIIYEENDMLVVLATGCCFSGLKEELKILYQRNYTPYIGIGSTVTRIQDIYLSYKKACIAYRLSRADISGRITCYDELGMYQIITDYDDSSIYHKFVEHTLGPLIEYDKENGTNHIEVLECFFRNECSLQRTAEVLFYHKNTLKYKIKAIREILGHDITSNENRVRIIVSFYILHLGDNFFEAV